MFMFTLCLFVSALSLTKTVYFVCLFYVYFLFKFADLTKNLKIFSLVNMSSNVNLVDNYKN